ncbi:MAG: hypothetical protein ABEJ65_02460, partial [bacterium]
TEQVFVGFSAIGPEISVGYHVDEQMPRQIMKQKTPKNLLVTVESSSPMTIRTTLGILSLVPQVSMEKNQITIGQKPDTVAMYLETTDNFLLFGLDKKHLQSAVKRTRGKTGLTASDNYRELKKKAPSKLTQLVYWDFSPVGTLLKKRSVSEQLPIADQTKKARKRLQKMGYDFNPVVEAASLIESLPGSLSVAWNKPDQSVIHNKMYAGPEAIVVPIAAAGGAAYKTMGDRVAKYMSSKSSCEQKASEVKNDMATIRTAFVACEHRDKSGDCDPTQFTMENYKGLLEPEMIQNYRIETNNGALQKVIRDDVGCAWKYGKRGMIYHVNENVYEPFSGDESSQSASSAEDKSTESSSPESSGYSALSKSIYN